MDNSTLCYIERDGKYLMLHRIKKDIDINRDKWIGIGGHFEEGESPYDCVIREVNEETGFRLISPKYRGIVTFTTTEPYTEHMHLFTCTDFSGELTDCDEGTLEWVDKDKICDLPIWEGDKVFLSLISTDCPFFSLKLSYDGDRLVEAVLDNKKLTLGYLP